METFYRLFKNIPSQFCDIYFLGYRKIYGPGKMYYKFARTPGNLIFSSSRNEECINTTDK